MFCRNCGQEQAAESVRFCSRCGFELNKVEGALPKRSLSMSMFLVVTACAIFGWGSFTSGPGYMQVRVIITIIAAMAFYLLFQNDLKHIFHKFSTQNNEPETRVMSAAHRSSLPPEQSLPAADLGGRRVNTAEIVQPPSITEHTTKLLDDDKR